MPKHLHRYAYAILLTLVTLPIALAKDFYFYGFSRNVFQAPARAIMNLTPANWNELNSLGRFSWSPWYYVRHTDQHGRAYCWVLNMGVLAWGGGRGMCIGGFHFVLWGYMDGWKRTTGIWRVLSYIHGYPVQHPHHAR